MADKEDTANQDETSQMDWNKKGFETSERLTLKINVHEANRYQLRKNKTNPSELSGNMKNLRKKVRDSYSEENDDGVDEDVLRSLQQLQINLTDASNGDNSLLEALSPEEKRFITQNTNIEISRHEQNSGKLNALLQAESLSQQAGISKMSASDFANQMQDAIYNPGRVKRQSLENNIAKKMGLKGEIKKHNLGKVVQGVKQIKKVSGNKKVGKMTMDDAAYVGKKKLSKNATAELILKKSGQNARLSEIKMKTVKENKTAPRSYSAQMKQLLKDSLRKNDNVH